MIQQYRSMSNDSYSGSQDYNGITPSRYSGGPSNSAAYSMQPQPAYAPNDHTQQWQQAHRNGMPSRMATHPTMHHQQQPNTQMAVPASGPMDVDGNGAFFSGEVKRHLFW